MATGGAGKVPAGRRRVRAGHPAGPEPILEAAPGKRLSVGGDKRGSRGEAAGLVEVREEGRVQEVPDYKTQKEEIRGVLHPRLRKGDTWYLVDAGWLKQCKKFVGYDQWDQSSAGLESAHPGPIDNSYLFKNTQSEDLKEHLMEELDYSLVPEPAWNKLLTWYGLSEGSRPIARRVVKHGLYMKVCKVEVYLLEFKLSIHPKTNETVTKMFSRADTVGDLEMVLRQTFGVPKKIECRVWHLYMTNKYELLTNHNSTLGDVGLYSGQVIVLEVKNDDNSWPREVGYSSLTSTCINAWKEVCQLRKQRDEAVITQEEMSEARKEREEALGMVSSLREEIERLQEQVGQLQLKEDQVQQAEQAFHEYQSTDPRSSSPSDTRPPESSQKSLAVHANKVPQDEVKRKQPPQEEHTGRRRQSLWEEVRQLQEQRDDAVKTETLHREQLNEAQKEREVALGMVRSLQEEIGQLQEDSVETERALSEQVAQLQQQIEEDRMTHLVLQEELGELRQLREEAIRTERALHEQVGQLQLETEQAQQAERALREQISDLQAQQEQATQLDQQQRDQMRQLQAEVERLQHSMRQETSSREVELWKTPRESVQILAEIDSGAWGCVAKGIFRGKEVAVKWPHRAILDHYVVGRLRREVRMMAHVRHPNLLLFIAAVFDEEADNLQKPPLVVTELLDTNLRSAYRNGRLEKSAKLLILCDVACALNYLHQHQEPIIHRDVSAPNVLLEALPDNKWKAKLSDFGSANLARQARTAGEGAIIYAAPETFPVRSRNAVMPPQTPKIDVYSYGVLLCEVSTNRIPFQEVYQDMLGEVQRQSLFMYNLIESCTQQNATDRPSMSDVLAEIDAKIAEPSEQN